MSVCIDTDSDSLTRRAIRGVTTLQFEDWLRFARK